MQRYTTTAQQGLLEAQCASPIPCDVLGEAKGRLYPPEERERKFARAVFPRTTNRYGCVTLHHAHFYVEEGLPQTPVFLWGYGQSLRAVCDSVVLAEYACRYDLRHHDVQDIREGRLYTTRFASPPGVLIPRPPADTWGIYRPKPLRRQTRRPVPIQQLWLFTQGHVA